MKRAAGLSPGWFAVATAVLAITSLAANASAVTEYDFVYVDAFQPDYDLREAYLFDLNNQGVGVGFATDLPSYSGFFMSSVAEKIRLPFTLARGINEAGQIVGMNQVYDIATGGSTTIANVPGAVRSPIALDINDQGVVVGYAETCNCSNSDRTLQIPFVWDPVGGSRSIAVAGAKELVKLNNQNLAVGNIRGGSPDGFVYDLANGRTILLSAYLSTNPYPWTEAADINNLGMVTGRHRSDDAVSFHGFVWTEAGGAVLLPHLNSETTLDVTPFAINDAGTVVGMAEVANLVTHAFVWDTQHGIRDLNSLVTPPAGFILDRALGINERGWIIGDGHYGPTWSSSQAFVLVPRNEAALGVDPPAVTNLELRARPNPSTGSATLEYAIPSAGVVRIEIFDVRGRRVATLRDEAGAGVHRLVWSGRDDAGRLLGSGAYLVRLESAGGTITRRLVIAR